MIRRAIRNDIPVIVKIYNKILELEAEGKVHTEVMVLHTLVVDPQDYYPKTLTAKEALLKCFGIDHLFAR